MGYRTSAREKKYWLLPNEKGKSPDETKDGQEWLLQVPILEKVSSEVSSR